MIRYDNLKPAVVRVAAGSGPVREPAVRGAALPLRLRLVLLPPRCRGRAREGRGGGRDRPVPPPPPDPVPHVGSLAALNEALAAADARDDARRIGARAETVGEACRPGAAVAASAAGQRRSTPRRALLVPGRHEGPICVRQSYYSVPGPLRRPPGRRSAWAPTRSRVLRRRPGRRRACPLAAQGQRGPGPGPLPGGPDPQTRRVGRLDRAGRRPRVRGVFTAAHQGSGTRPAARSATGRHPGPDRGAAAAPHPARAPRSSPAMARRSLSRPVRPRPGRRRRPPHHAAPTRPAPPIAAARHRGCRCRTPPAALLAGYDQLLTEEQLA